MRAAVSRTRRVSVRSMARRSSCGSFNRLSTSGPAVDRHRGRQAAGAAGRLERDAIARLDELDFRAWLAPRVQFEARWSSVHPRALRPRLRLRGRRPGPAERRRRDGGGDKLPDPVRPRRGADSTMEAGMGDVFRAALRGAGPARGAVSVLLGVTGRGLSGTGPGRRVEVVDQVACAASTCRSSTWADSRAGRRSRSGPS